MRHIERNAVLLFMVPADADDITEQYNILQRELSEFNPELADKPRVLAISKCDMLDDELMAELESTLPEGVPHVFISAVTGLNLQQLKDMLWAEITSEANQLQAQSITHRALDGHHRVADEDALDFAPTLTDEDDADDFDDDDSYDEFDFDDEE